MNIAKVPSTLDPKSVWVGNVLAAHLFNTGEELVSLRGPLYGFPDYLDPCTLGLNPSSPIRTMSKAMQIFYVNDYQDDYQEFP